MAKTSMDLFSKGIKVLGKHGANSCSYIILLTLVEMFM